MMRKDLSGIVCVEIMKDMVNLRKENAVETHAESTKGDNESDFRV